MKLFRGKGKDGSTAPKIWVVSGCPKDEAMMQQANGVYFVTMHHLEKDISWDRVGWQQVPIQSQQRQAWRLWAPHQVGVCRFVSVRGSKTLDDGHCPYCTLAVVQLMWLLELSWKTPRCMYTSNWLECRPGRQPFSFKIMRIRTSSLKIHRTGY